MSELSSQIASRYGDVARSYRRLWAPQLLAFSQQLLSALPLQRGVRVADLGGGTGALASRIARRAGPRSVVIVDLSPGMMSQARAGSPHLVAGDATMLPLAPRSMDVVVSTFALQHITHPGVVVKEAARVLASGGRLATATWGTDHGESGRAYQVIDRVFERRRVPPDELSAMPTWHSRVESPSKMRRYARAAGLDVERAWVAQVVYGWKPADMLEWLSTMGQYGRRLRALDRRRREQVIHEIEHRFMKLTPGAFVWAPEVVFMIAVKR